MTLLATTIRTLEAELAKATGVAERANLQVKLGGHVANTEDRARGIALIRGGIALLEERGDGRALARALNTLGIVLDAPEARPVLLRALAVARDAGAASEEASSLHNLAILDEIDGDHDGAHARYTRAIEILRGLDERSKLAGTLNALGVLHRKDGRAGAARESWSEAKAIVPRGRPDTLASILDNEGSLLESEGDLPGAITRYREALALMEDVGEVRELIITLGNLALACTELGDRDEAVAARRRRLALLERCGDEEGVAEELDLLDELGFDDGAVP